MTQKTMFDLLAALNASMIDANAFDEEFLHSLVNDKHLSQMAKSVTSSKFCRSKELAFFGGFMLAIYTYREEIERSGLVDGI